MGKSAGRKSVRPQAGSGYSCVDTDGNIHDVFNYELFYRCRSHSPLESLRMIIEPEAGVLPVYFQHDSLGLFLVVSLGALVIAFVILFICSKILP